MDKHNIMIPRILIERLQKIARQGIVDHYDRSTHLFDFILRDEGPVKEKEGLLLTHSLITLLGVLDHKESVAIDFQESVNTICDLILQGRGAVREIALLLWLLARMKA